MNLAGFVFWCLAATTVLVHLKRWLAVQNVLAVAAILSGLGIALALLVSTGPGGAAEKSAGLHPILRFHPRWDFPPFWITTVLSSRAAARLVTQTWTRPPVGALMLAAGLIAVFSVSAQSLAAPGNRILIAGNFLPWPDAAGRWGLEFAAWMLAGLITQVLIAPWLINKRSTREFHRPSSLVIWLLPGLCLFGGLIERRAWFRTAPIFAAMLLVSMAGIRVIRRRAAGFTPPRDG